MTINLNAFIMKDKVTKSIDFKSVQINTLKADIDYRNACEKGEPYERMLERIDQGLLYLQTHKNDELFDKLFNYDGAFEASGVLEFGLEDINSKSYTAGMEAIKNQILDGIISALTGKLWAFMKWVDNAKSQAEVLKRQMIDKKKNLEGENFTDLRDALSYALSEGGDILATNKTLSDKFVNNKSDDYDSLISKSKALKIRAEKFAKKLDDMISNSRDKNLTPQEVGNMLNKGIGIAESISSGSNIAGWWKTGFKQGKSTLVARFLTGLLIPVKMVQYVGGGLNPLNVPAIALSSLIPSVRKKNIIAANSWKIYNLVASAQLDVINNLAD